MHQGGRRNGTGALRWQCASRVNGERVYCYSTTNPKAPERDSKSNSRAGAPKFTRPLGEVGERKRYLVTAAQNATPVHEGFWNSLLVCAEHLGAELVVIPLRYKNPTSRWTKSQQNAEEWADEVQDYLYNQRKKLNPNLVLVGDVKIQPTASSPLTGFEGLTHGESCILGHTKLQLKVVPVPAGKFPKILTTTGACTVRNYTDSKAGKVGAFHHRLGAVMVEVVGKRFHLRQISAAADGSFTDLDTKYTEEGVAVADPALALIMGDTHVRFTCPGVERATWGKGGIIEALNPKTLVWHDVLDGYSINPHHAGNPFIAMAKQGAGLGNVRAEVEDTVRFLDEHTVGRDSVVVASNHDNFLARWVAREDWKTAGIANAPFYLETAKVMLESAKINETGATYADPFKHWVGRLSKNPRVRCLDQDESFAVAGIECGMHGDNGPNGSRGTIKNMRRLGSRVVIGHSHTPGIEEGAYQTGTSTRLRAEYTHGPSSWLNAHVVVYASGKRSLIFIIDGEWRMQESTSKRKVSRTPRAEPRGLRRVALYTAESRAS